MAMNPLVNALMNRAPLAVPRNLGAPGVKSSMPRMLGLPQTGVPALRTAIPHPSQAGDPRRFNPGGLLALHLMHRADVMPGSRQRGGSIYGGGGF